MALGASCGSQRFMTKPSSSLRTLFGAINEGEELRGFLLDSERDGMREKRGLAEKESENANGGLGGNREVVFRCNRE